MFTNMYSSWVRNTVWVKATILYIAAVIVTLHMVFQQKHFVQTREKRNEPMESLTYFAKEKTSSLHSNFGTVHREKFKNVNKFPPSEFSLKEHQWELDQGNVPELSIMTGNGSSGPKWYNSSCAKFPDLFTVQFSNVYWQVQQTNEEIYYLYSAYLDIRGENTSRQTNQQLFDNALIRVLAMSTKINLNSSTSLLTSCQFWFSHQLFPVFGKIIEIKMLWNYKWGSNAGYYPYLLTCQVPKELKDFPVSVSLAPSICFNATNNLNIINRNRIFNINGSSSLHQEGFGVCVKALDFPNAKMRNRLIEWIEIIRLLGANKIFFYEYFVDSDIETLLEYYKNIGVVDVIHTTLPGHLPNQAQLRHHYIRKMIVQKRLTEVIPYNDCLLRNMYDFKYVAVMDTDELLVPAEHITWSQLINIVKEADIGLESMSKRPVTTFCFRNHYYLDEMIIGKEHEVSAIPPEFHMLRHIYHSQNYTGWSYMKCFHSTAETLGVHNHVPFYCRDGKRCVRHKIKTTRAYMHHYRATCVKELKSCSKYLNNTVKDTKLWRYKEYVLSRMETVRNILHF